MFTYLHHALLEAETDEAVVALCWGPIELHYMTTNDPEHLPGIYAKVVQRPGVKCDVDVSRQPCRFFHHWSFWDYGFSTLGRNEDLLVLKVKHRNCQKCGERQAKLMEHFHLARV
jgi:hypothetical protein